jgi:hypothetical protein
MDYKVVPIPLHDGSTRTTYELSNGTQTWEALPGLWFVSNSFTFEDVVVEATTNATYLLYQPEGGADELWPINIEALDQQIWVSFTSIVAFLLAHPEFVRPNSIRPTEF